MVEGPVHEFESEPLTHNFLDNLIVTWPHRLIKRSINYDEDLSNDDQYKEWIQLQKIEKDMFMQGSRSRESYALGSHDA